MTFVPGDHLTDLQGKDYLEVKWRLVWIHDDWKAADGAWSYSITTEIEDSGEGDEDPFVVMSARVSIFTVKAGQQVILRQGTGFSRETFKGFKRGYIEKCETAAIGRALSTIGYGTQFDEGDGADDKVADAPVERKKVGLPKVARKVIVHK